MKQELEARLTELCKKVFNADVAVQLTRPDEQFGDYATNVAMQLAGKLGKNPREIAASLTEAINEELSDTIAGVNVAGPGFINLRLTDNSLVKAVTRAPAQPLVGQSWVIEYSCPNAFKELHAGHLYQTIAGDVISRLVERAGATVHRTNFGGDVGLHVGKAMWGIIEELGGENPAKLAEVAPDQRSQFLSKAYVRGAAVYETDEAVKAEIIQYNKQIYALHQTNDHESAFAQIYWTCRQWSYDYFNAFYETIRVLPFEKYYPESATSQPGLEAVRAHIADGIFKESEGAVVYEGEKVGLHTRVFITKNGLPTYEAKDVGVILSELNDFNFDYRVIMTGNDQSQYMKVVFAATQEMKPELKGRMTHLTNGTIRFGNGQKMSSRLGNVNRAVEVLDIVGELVPEAESPERKDDVMLGAVKYAFLKIRLGGDIAFDPEESVSIQGNSGPYLQYAHARACSILRKVPVSPHISGENMCSDAHVHSKVRSASVLDSHPELHSATETLQPGVDLEEGERSLLRKMSEYQEVVALATAELLPHHICNYLYELAQTFNRFYEHNRVMGDERESLRLRLVAAYTDILKDGLELLGIPAPTSM